jgi:salicylate hydroxylase
MQNSLLVVGGGIGGLASALACAKAGWRIDLLEQATEFSEFGAGIQLGPNAVRILHDWGLAAALASCAARPTALEIRDAGRGHVLAEMPLAGAMERQFGAPYVTIARADLQQILLSAVRAHPLVALHAGVRCKGYKAITLPGPGSPAGNRQDGVSIESDASGGRDSRRWDAAALIGADGIWSAVRKQLLGDAVPRVSGHLAYRAMLPQADLPAAMRLDRVRVWMGPRFHCVQYPVRGGDWLNVVVIVQGPPPQNIESWDHSANAADLQARLGTAAPELQALIQAIPGWRLWPLCDRPPMRSAAEHGHGRVVLIGDAAHPMRPYLAQGAGMAIEDSWVLARCMPVGGNVSVALGQFASERWARNARVQARAIRNGEIFHLQGPMALARDWSLRMLGTRLLDLSWLYSGPG